MLVTSLETTPRSIHPAFQQIGLLLSSPYKFLVPGEWPPPSRARPTKALVRARRANMYQSSCCGSLFARSRIDVSEF